MTLSNYIRPSHICDSLIDNCAHSVLFCGLKRSYGAFMRDSISRKRPVVFRGFTKHEDVKNIDRLMDNSFKVNTREADFDVFIFIQLRFLLLSFYKSTLVHHDQKAQVGNLYISIFWFKPDKRAAILLTYQTTFVF